MPPPASSHSVPTILSIPLEVVEHILLFCHPHDVARFSSSCRFGEHLVYHSVDQYFWRQLFLLMFDDPRETLPLRVDTESFDWKFELVRRMKAERAAFVAPESLETATFISIVNQALPVFKAYGDPPPSRNLEWLGSVLRKSRILDDPSPSNDLMLRDRLKAYLALSYNEPTIHNKLELFNIRTRSRCFVYDLRNYHAGNSWGPYLPDGNVNWSHVDCIVNVVESNLREQGSAHIPRPPLGLQATRAHSAPGKYSGEDWAGVEGPRDPSFFDDVDFREATRLIELRLHLITEDKMRSPVFPDYPPVYFSGSSRGALGQEATVQGFVHMGKDCIPRWRFTSIHDGHPQWSSEGVQLGNVGSAMGVAGTWTAPFWFWKLSDHHNPHAL
ncbi:hypothetical protein C8J57DRAFT_1429070 [Mycena rebaudengoi]|nr:hypothetical protein C8J57DRAFT_1429070 [Mycena rebaudengoi]